MAVKLPGASDLTPTEKLRLIESLWDDLTNDPAAVPVEDWQKAELDRREAAAETTPDAGSDWEDVKARVSGRRGS